MGSTYSRKIANENKKNEYILNTMKEIMINDWEYFNKRQAESIEATKRINELQKIIEEKSKNNISTDAELKEIQILKIANGMCFYT